MNLTDVFVLDVSPWLALVLDDVLRLSHEVLEEELRRYGDCEYGIVGAVGGFFVSVDDLLDASHWLRSV